MALVVTIKVVPSAGKSACKLDKSGMVKVYLKSPAQQGKANSELITFLAKALRVPAGDISIISGATARTKMVKIAAELTQEQFLEHLGIQKQMNLF